MKWVALNRIPSAHNCRGCEIYIYIPSHATKPIFHQRGAPLAAGMDLRNPWMTSGVSYHRELRLRAAPGIPPLQVLRIATRSGAEALGIVHETGTVEAGKWADLIVLAGDPLKDIGNARCIEHVFIGGREFTPAVLLRRRAK